LHKYRFQLKGGAAGPAVSPHITTVHLPAATVFLSHTTSRYSVLAYFFRQTNGAKICMLVTIHSQIFVTLLYMFKGACNHVLVIQ